MRTHFDACKLLALSIRACSQSLLPLPKADVGCTQRQFIAAWLSYTVPAAVYLQLPEQLTHIAGCLGPHQYNICMVTCGKSLRVPSHTRC